MHPTAVLHHPVGSLDWCLEAFSHVRASLPSVMTVLGLICIALLVYAVATSVSIRPGPQPEARRMVSFTPGFWASLGFVAGLYLIGKGFEAVATGLAPKWSLLGLCAALPIGWAAGMGTLAVVRKDITGIPFLDGCLLGLPAGIALWSMVVALFFSDIGLTFTGVLLALAIAFAISRFCPGKEPDHGR